MKVELTIKQGSLIRETKVTIEGYAPMVESLVKAIKEEVNKTDNNELR